MQEQISMSDSNRRIAKNTVYLYFRTFFSIIVSLYTSRIFLNQLGVEDFGIYNLVGGVVAIFSVLNSMLSSATQRFLSIEMGKGSLGNTDKILNISICIHMGLALAFLVVGEIGGNILLRCLNIPSGKEQVAAVVFHLSMLTAAVSLFKTPYNALIIAKEKMSFYAYMSIFEVLARLAITCLLVYSLSKLILYSSLLLVLNAILVVCCFYYVKRTIGLPKFKLYSFKENEEYKKLLSFSVWTLLGNASSVGRDQGMSFLLNLFYGVMLNAAMGIMVQISNVFSSLFLNLQSAFRPQVIQCSVNERERYNLLLNRCMFYSLSFMGLVCIPMTLCCKVVLALWLGQVPQYTVELVQLLMVKIIFASVSQSVFVALEANGRIRNVQIGTTVMSGVTLVLAYLVLLIGARPFWVMGATVLMELTMLAYRMIVAGKYGCLDVRGALKHIVAPLLATIFMLVAAVLLSPYIQSLVAAVWSIIGAELIYTCIIAFAMKKSERKRIVAVMMKKI